jgi:2,3,4,5-tetrahydropyridine-2,6-dicarboxylate N-succinyltransferase
MKEKIEQVWESLQESHIPDIAKSLSEEVLELLDNGKVRVAEKVGNKWQVNDWVKKAILIYFKTHESQLMDIAGDRVYWDKIPLKFLGWNESNFMNAGCRVIPGATVRKGAYLASKVVVMPAFINIGAYVGTGSMIDSQTTIGSCAQIGMNCHISAGVTIGGVLEPLQANPVIIEDNVFIGAGSQIVEGVIIEENAVVGMGVILGGSTKILDRATGEVYEGRVPSNSVVVQGLVPNSDGKTMILGALIIKKIDANTRAKTSINNLLRN